VVQARAAVGNLSLVAGQKQTQRGMADRTNFLPTINSVPFVIYMILMKLGNLWSFDYINF